MRQNGIHSAHDKQTMKSFATTDLCLFVEHPFRLEKLERVARASIKRHAEQNFQGPYFPTNSPIVGPGKSIQRSRCIVAFYRFLC